MIELTEQQRRAIAERPEEPLLFYDPETKQQFVLARVDLFDEHVRNGKPFFASLEEEAAHFGVYPSLLRGMKAYWRELPSLLQGWWKRGKWVAYHGDTRIGAAKTTQKLFRECRRRGIPLDEVYYARIVHRLLPPWEPESMDGTLYEFDEVEEETGEELTSPKES